MCQRSCLMQTRFDWNLQNILQVRYQELEWEDANKWDEIFDNNMLSCFCFCFWLMNLFFFFSIRVVHCNQLLNYRCVRMKVSGVECSKFDSSKLTSNNIKHMFKSIIRFQIFFWQLIKSQMFEKGRLFEKIILHL